MLINRQDFDLLKTLSTTKELVSIDTIPSSLKPDFQYYFFGKTLMKENNLLYAYPHDIRNWVRFVFEKYNG